MKNTLAILLGLALGGCVSSVAESAEAAPERLERFKQGDKFGFKDETGKVVIEPIYDDAGEFVCGLAAVNRGAQVRYVPLARRDGGKWGYINTQGKVVVPFTLRWAGTFSDGLAQVGDDRGRRFIDTEGKTLITLGDVSQAGNFSEGLAPIYIDRSLQKKGWQTQFIDKKGETVLTVDGYAEGFHEGMAVLIVGDGTADGNGKYGFMDRNGKVVIAAKFAEAHRFSEGLAPVRTKKTTMYGKGDTWGYIDKNGQWVLKPEFNETHEFRNGVARVHVGGTLRRVEFHAPLVWQGGEWRLIDRKGNVLKRSAEWVEYRDSADKSPKTTP